MKKLFKVFFVGLYTTNLFSQTTQDTINNPYWMDMMYRRDVNFYQTQRAFNLYFSDKEKIRGTGYKQFERWAENAKREINADGSFRPADFLLKELSKFKSNSLTPRSGNPKWTSLGPFNNPAPANMQRGVGRVNVIAFHPTDPNILYCGAPSGGLWYTKDKAQSWIMSNTDNLPRFGVSSIAVIPEANSTPIVLAGTGDRDANDAPGLGVYVSMDGGVNFSPSNTGMGNKVVNRLLVNYLDNNVIVAATSDGIYKSYNKGQNWVKTSISSDFKDVVYHPEDTNFVYAAAGGTFYRSINGGNTWTAVSSGFTTVSKRRMAIAVTKARPDIVYIITVNASTNGMEGFYKSSNKGLNFTLQLNGTTFNPLGFNSNGSGTTGQGFYDLAIDASQIDSNVVYVGGINVFRTVDGGKTFRCKGFWSFSATIPWVHADIHFLGRNPSNHELWIGSDGGIDYSADERLPSSGTNDPLFPVINNRNSGLAISQFYNLGVSQASLNKFITGSQDNGTSAGTNKNDWTAELGGDGMQCEISNFNPDVMFGCIQYGDLNRSANGGLSWNNIVSSINERPGPWVTPYHLHPGVDNILVAIYRNVWISRNATGSGNPTFTRITSNATAEGSAVRFSNVNNNYFFCGWKDGVLRYSSNILSTGSFIGMNSPMVNGEITDIETSYNDVNTLYVTKGNRVFRTKDLGQNWTNISGNLPNIGINCIVLDKNTPEALYVGTDAGIYYKDSSMGDWILYSDGMSLNAPIRDMEVVYDTDCSANSKIFAATYGRGLWLNTVQVTSNGSLELNSDKGNEICKGEKIVLTANGADEYFYDASPSLTKNSPNTFTLAPNESGQFRFYAKKSDNTCESKTFNVIVNPLPVVNVNPKTKTINKGETVVITGSGADEYAWSPSTFIQSGNNSNNLQVKPENTITYTLTGKDGKGCTNTIKVTITVNGSSAINSSKNTNIEIYPNPSSQSLFVKSPSKVGIRLIDAYGKLVYTEENENYFHNIDVNRFAVGLYIIEIISGDLVIENHKIKIDR
ncbi:MAG: T9SS type A sorting domain-containing protein [Chitinophagales bacterium]|jgi:hypothetical protein|nr:T9SS type A sorting domain-containing protein [Sphingobacteriales bacterium]